jgi:hypothetical protein
MLRDVHVAGRGKGEVWVDGRFQIESVVLNECCRSPRFPARPQTSRGRYKHSVRYMRGARIWWCRFPSDLLGSSQRPRPCVDCSSKCLCRGHAGPHVTFPLSHGCCFPSHLDLTSTSCFGCSACRLLCGRRYRVWKALSQLVTQVIQDIQA